MNLFLQCNDNDNNRSYNRLYEKPGNGLISGSLELWPWTFKLFDSVDLFTCRTCKWEWISL